MLVRLRKKQKEGSQRQELGNKGMKEGAPTGVGFQDGSRKPQPECQTRHPPSA